MSGMADRGPFWRASTQREFDVTFAMTDLPEGIEAGRTARIRIEGTPLRAALSLARQAVFDRDGTPTVFVRQNRGVVPTRVKVIARTQTRVVIDDLAEGTEVVSGNRIAIAVKRRLSKSPDLR